MGQLEISPVYTRCLGLGHDRKICKQSVRCNVCFNYGHIFFQCLSKKRVQWRFRPVSRLKGEESGKVHLYSGASPSLDSSSLHQSPNPPSPPKYPTPTMANWPVDPVPHVPAGFVLEETHHPYSTTRSTSPGATPSTTRISPLSSFSQQWTRRISWNSRQPSAPSSTTSIKFALLKSSRALLAMLMSGSRVH